MGQVKIKKCLKIMKMEMEDLLEDIISMEELYIKRQENKEITNYILKGNSSLLAKEKSGIRAVLNELKTIKSSSYSDLDNIAEKIKMIIRGTVSNKQLPESVRMLSERKLSKVLKYINEA